jgi:hypothetical protein
MDFNNTLIRCSSLSCLFTEPKSVADKKAGLLSKTARTHLVEVYIRQQYGVEKPLDNKYVRKGIEAEEEGITLLSLVDKKFYTKNDIRKENDFITGECDIDDDEIIIDTKLSYDYFSFIPKLIESIDDNYWYQMQGYMWLWNKKKARIAYCLVDTPDSIIEEQKMWLLKKFPDAVTSLDPAYESACRKLEASMRFNHVPIEQRVISHYVERDESVIEQIPQKVTKAREFLAELYELHINQNKLQLI